jgi:nucleoside-diphosphate-sugar epimerase
MKKIVVTGGSGFIGTNLLEDLLERGETSLLNLDARKPKIAGHERIWKPCEILNPTELFHHFQEFKPTHVVHLAGRTDMDGKILDEYAANHVGTVNVIRAIQQTSSVKRAIFTSSQFVVSPGPEPKTDLEFRPHTLYGVSKAKSEEAVRAANLSCEWTIIRPTNIWGRWHPRYPNEFWRVLKQGRYIHPGGRNVRRCYGYVGTVVDQIRTILDCDPRLINRTVLYMGDPPIDLIEWTNAFSLELTGRPVRVVPQPVLHALAKVGDLVISMGGKFPIFTSRYRSMTEDYVTPMEKTFARLGVPQTGLRQGVKATVEWLRSTGPFWSK